MELQVVKRQFITPKRIIISIGVIIIICITGTLGVSIYVGWNLTHPVHEPIVEKPSMYGIKYENISFSSSFDGTKLKGWWIPSIKSNPDNGQTKTIIFAHGYGNTRDLSKIHVLLLAKYLSGQGYNVLTFDFRNSGESEGKVTSVGVFEKYDLLSAVQFAKKVKKSDKIALCGWSMGAATSICAGTESPDVSVIIADSSFADLTDYLKSNLSVWSGLPDFPFTPIIMKCIPLIIDADAGKVSPYKAVKNLGNRKLLLIHSKGDKSIPYENSLKIYDSVPDKSNVEIWITQKADHIKTYLEQKQEYEDKISAFLSKNF